MLTLRQVPVDSTTAMHAIPGTLARMDDLIPLHDGVVTRAELHTMGMTYHEVEAQLAARRWQAVGPLVVVTHNGPLTRAQQLWVAVLNAGDPAALAGRSAAEHAGLQGWSSPLVHVVVPRGRHVPKLPTSRVDIRVHESRRFGAEDVHPTRTPPQTRIARSVVDAATWTRNARSACGLLAAAVQQRLTTAEALTAELDAAGRIRHHSLLRRMAVDIGGGAHAVSETDFTNLCRRYGLPEPERQVVRTEAGGRRRYLDNVLRGPDGREVVVEVDGALHLLPTTYWDDMSRDNELVIDGRRRLRFPTVAMWVDADRVAAQLARALGLPVPAKCQSLPRS